MQLRVVSNRKQEIWSHVGGSLVIMCMSDSDISCSDDVTVLIR